MSMFRSGARSKYGNKRVVDKGRSFMSLGERDCAAYLQILEKAGEISNLEFQVSIRLGPNNRRWVLDFKFVDEKRHEVVWADFKGMETDRWTHLLDLWLIGGPSTLRVYKGKGMRMQIAYEVVPQNADLTSALPAPLDYGVMEPGVGFPKIKNRL